MKDKSLLDYSLYLVTDRDLLDGKDLLTTVEDAIKGGVTALQLREKDVSTFDFYNIAIQVKAIAKKYNIPFIINDRVDIALAVNADGLHIGQKDMPLSVARKLMGPDKIIGVSAASVDQALKAETDGADYLGIGAIFPTGTKDDADSVSLEELQKIKDIVSVPVVAIGGINDTNIKKVMVAGADGAAVVSAIIAHSDPYQAAVKLIQLIKS